MFAMFFYYRSTDLFLKLIYVDPGFSRTNEAHLRLGHMKKVRGDFQDALKHFKLALADQSPCTLSPFEIRFHIAHLYEINEKAKQAKTLYEQLLKEKDLPAQLRADVNRQLGTIPLIQYDYMRKTFGFSGALLTCILACLMSI